MTKYPVFSKTNKSAPGTVSLDVLAAEMILKTLGYDVNEPDGVYDQKSFEQIIKFQGDNLLYPYGTIDVATQNALYNALMKHAQGDIEDLQLKEAIKALTK